jgi:LemA protein
LERALSRLLVLQENYPQLKANESFLKMMDSLEGTENRLAVERKRYNETVRVLNTYIRTVFGRFFAGLAGVSKAEYFQSPGGRGSSPEGKILMS